MASPFNKNKEPEPVKPKITEQDKAVLALKQQRDKLIQYRKKREMNLEKERQLAKQLLQEGKKNEAELPLKRMRDHEQALERIDNQLQNVKKTVQDVELGEIQSQVADGLKQGNEALKKIPECVTKNSTEVPTEDPPGYALSLGLANDSRAQKEKKDERKADMVPA